MSLRTFSRTKARFSQVRYSVFCIKYEIVYLPFPKDADRIPYPLAPDFPFFNLPPEALSETGAELICFQEKRLLGNERIGTRPLPAQVFTQSSLRPEAFAHISFADTSPESLCDLMCSLGLMVAPVFDSQKRFIDSRFHNVMDDDFSYAELHPLETVEVNTVEDADLLDLMQAAIDIYKQHYVALSGAGSYHGSFEELYGGSLIQAVTLSEYARRIVSRGKDEETGGIISYYEVLLTTRALFGAMTDLIDFSIAGGSMVRYEKLVKERAEKGEIRSIGKYALEMLSTVNAVTNVASYIVQEDFDFLQQCVMTTTGAQWGQVLHQSSPAKEFHEGIAVKTPALLESQRNFYERNEPRYLNDRYCEGSASAALAAQFMATMADPAPWKRCDSPECGAYFKHRFTEKGRSNPKATSCSKRCSTRKRNRIANLEKSAISTACRRHKTIEEAVAYVEVRLGAEIDPVDIPLARKRWRQKCCKELR